MFGPGVAETKKVMTTNSVQVCKDMVEMAAQRRQRVDGSAGYTAASGARPGPQQVRAPEPDSAGERDDLLRRQGAAAALHLPSAFQTDQGRDAADGIAG